MMAFCCRQVVVSQCDVALTCWKVLPSLPQVFYYKNVDGKCNMQIKSFNMKN